MSTDEQKQWSSVMLFALAISILLILAKQQVHANSIAAPNAGPTNNQQPTRGVQAGTHAVIDEFIHELLDDAGERMKKSKMNSMRSVKQTLRFGRRSDPSQYWEEPIPAESEQMAIAVRPGTSLANLLLDKNANDQLDE